MTQKDETLKEGVFENSELVLLKQLISIFSDVSLLPFVQHIQETEKTKATRRRNNEKKLLNEFEEVIISGGVDDSEPDEDFENVGELELETLKEKLDLPSKSEYDIALQALEDFKRLYQNEYKLSEHKHLKFFEDFFTLLVTNCICSDNWLVTCEWSVKVVYLTLYCLRIFLRNVLFQKMFIGIKNSFACLSKIFLKYSEYYSCMTIPILLHAHIVDQLLNILTKIFWINTTTPNKEISKIFFENELHVSLMQLIITSNDICLIHGSLNLFMHLLNIDVENKARLVNDLDLSDQLLLMLQEYDEDSKKFASKLLCSLCSEEKIKSEITHLDGIQILLSLLHKHNNTDILWNIIWCLVQLSSFVDNKKEIRLMGGIPLILSVLHDRPEPQLNDSGTSSSSNLSNQTNSSAKQLNSNEIEESQIQLVKRSKAKYQIQAACCALIGELAFNETNSYQIVNTNGFYLVASKLLTSKNDSPAEMEPNKEIERLHCNAWRTLRLLFSNERHRSLVKKIIPFNMFEQFCDIGNFKKDLKLYQPLLEPFYKLSKEDLEIMRQQIKFCNQTQTPTNYINDYAVYEIIGSGAFGRVHKVKKKNSNYFLAMKEINTYNLTNMRDKSLGDIVNEVTIIRNNLKHPNIVRYLKTFKENDNLYIVMELIDGAPLSQHVRTLKEKQERWHEDKIWNLFIQMVLALKYLHKEKHIVHRDLSSNNIMLSENDKITITDFGLAKLKESSCSKMLSVVGTMFYSCPEIIKNEPYNDKADIWALGCCLYEICCLEQPFCTSNMLALATKITESDYDKAKLTKNYSMLVSNVVQTCLRVDPAERPDIVGVAGVIAEKVLTYTDVVRYKCNNLEKKLEKEKNKTQKMFHTKQDRGVTNCPSYNSQNSKASNDNEMENKSFFLPPQVSEVKSTPNSLEMRAGRKGAEYNRSTSSINGTSPSSSSRKNSESNNELVTTKIRIPTPSQSVAIVKNQVSTTNTNQNCSPNAKLPPLRNPKSKMLMKNIKKQQQQQQQLQTQVKTIAKPQPQKPTTSSTPEKSQFLTSETNVEENLIFNPIEREIKSTEENQSNVGKIHRSTSSSSVLEKHSSQTKKNRPSSANTPVYKKLRPIEDPILQILDQLHKVIFITQLPPKGIKNFKQKLIERYKRYLFSNKRNSMQIKAELMKLMKFSTELIDMEVIGLRSFQLTYNSSDSSNNKTTAQASSSSFSSNEVNIENLNTDLELIISQNGITYEQLQNIIEELIMQNNYHEENLKYLREELPFVD